MDVTGEECAGKFCVLSQEKITKRDAAIKLSNGSCYKLGHFKSYIRSLISDSFRHFVFPEDRRPILQEDIIKLGMEDEVDFSWLEGASAPASPAALPVASPASGYDPRRPFMADLPVSRPSQRTTRSGTFVGLRNDGNWWEPRPVWSIPEGSAGGNNNFHRFNSLHRWGILIDSRTGESSLPIWKIEAIDKYLLDGQSNLPFDYNIDSNIKENANQEKLRQLIDGDSDNVILRLIRNDESAYTTLSTRGGTKRKRRKTKKTKRNTKKRQKIKLK